MDSRRMGLRNNDESSCSSPPSSVIMFEEDVGDEEFLPKSGPFEIPEEVEGTDLLLFLPPPV